MPQFSDRIGATQPRPIQLDGMDAQLRTALWNWLVWALERDVRAHNSWHEEYWYNAAKGGVWDVVMHRSVDEVQTTGTRRSVKEWFMQAAWFNVYNLIEFMLPRVNRFRGQYDHRDNIEAHLNYYLEREMSGYRAVRGELVPVTSPAELAEIDRAATRTPGFEGVAEHINTALSLLSKKPEPDYRNSVKESISAVESVVRLLTGGKSGSIDKALALLEKKHALHPVFKVAVSKLYAYTSDKDGVRHALIDESVTVTPAEAKFMLVACSAFANFLIDSSRT